ncbi:siderophore-iron reductase FhuF (plasmid) [Microvirga sp. VF16]|nr:siderophore-iron reductase FhuF [Microvirga sp. VF16]
MIEALRPVFHGVFAPFGHTLTLDAAGRRVIPGADLLDRARFDEIVDAFGAHHYPGADRRPLVSMWSQWYLGVVLPPVMLASLIGDHRLPLRLEETALVLNEDAQPAALLLSHEGEVSSPADMVDRFEGLVRHHLAPLCEAVATHGGLSPRVP